MAATAGAEYIQGQGFHPQKKSTSQGQRAQTSPNTPIMLSWPPQSAQPSHPLVSFPKGVGWQDARLLQGAHKAARVVLLPYSLTRNLSWGDTGPQDKAKSSEGWTLLASAPQMDKPSVLLQGCTCPSHRSSHLLPSCN